jgi:hypothetical protein
LGGVPASKVHEWWDDSDKQPVPRAGSRPVLTIPGQPSLFLSFHFVTADLHALHMVQARFGYGMAMLVFHMLAGQPMPCPDIRNCCPVPAGGAALAWGIDPLTRIDYPVPVTRYS